MDGWVDECIDGDMGGCVDTKMDGRMGSSTSSTIPAQTANFGSLTCSCIGSGTRHSKSST